MCPTTNEKSARDTSTQVEEFLRRHPGAREALEIFGITEERYAEYMAALQTPTFYTTSSTAEARLGGELD